MDICELDGDRGEVISYLKRLIWASEDDCWERKLWHWDDKVGGAGEIGVVGDDGSCRDKLWKDVDDWVGDNDMEGELFEFWVLELDESKSEGGVGINKSSSESLSYS